jgi:hypothetical protein
MRWTGIFFWFLGFARSYLVAFGLVGIVAYTFVKAMTGGIGPVPQHPPDGLTIVRQSEQLEWSKGLTRGKMRLQVSAGSRDFSGELIVDKTVKINQYALKNLAPGTTYYWRIIENGKAGRVSTFNVAKDAVTY